MPRLTYKALTPDDPTFVQVGSTRFEHGKSVEVDDATHARLSKNPWFQGGRAAKDRAAELTASSGMSPGPDSGLDSSVVPAYPPGSGAKYNEPTVFTNEGFVPSEDASDIDGANVLSEEGDGEVPAPDEAEAPRRGRPRRNG